MASYSRTLSDLPLFRKSKLHERLIREPLGFIDIGARGDAHPLTEAAPNLVSMLGFEPDQEAFKVLSEEAPRSPFARAEYSPFALAAQNGPSPLHLCAAETNHSLRPPNKLFCHRYGMVKFECVGKTEVECRTLDDLLLPRLEREPHLAELLKIDTQGTEHEILRGGEQLLSRQTLALFVEVSFSPIYSGQSHFSELELYLRGLGFTFYGFDALHFRSRKALDKQRQAGRERLLFSDAVFFKDACAQTQPSIRLNERQLQALFFSTILLGYYDFALELLPLATQCKGEHDLLESVVHHCAQRPPTEVVSDLAGLRTRLDSSPHLANILTGKFVDAHRTWPNYDEITLPEPTDDSLSCQLRATRSISSFECFRRTDFFRALQSQPLACLEVSPDEGIFPIVEPMAEVVKIDRLANDAQQTRSTADQELIRRYGMQNFERLGFAAPGATSFPASLPDRLSEQRFSGEFIKIGCPDAAYEILQGRERILQQNTTTLILKCSFARFCSNSPCFSEMEVWLRERGFVIYGLHHLRYANQGRLNKMTEAGRERIFSADAVFFRDPLDEANLGRDLSIRQLTSLLAGAILLRYHDFALELVEKIDAFATDRADLSEAIRQFASVSTEETTREVADLTRRVGRNPEWANILAGNFFDRRRYYTDYDEVLL
jgi:FkbM family methyltransferase